MVAALFLTASALSLSGSYQRCACHVCLWETKPTSVSSPEEALCACRGGLQHSGITRKGSRATAAHCSIKDASDFLSLPGHHKAQ